MKTLNENLILERKIKYGRQLLFRFENLYGLSVIEETIGEGPRYNLAVIKFDQFGDDYEPDYTTKIANKDIYSDNFETISHLCYLVSKLSNEEPIHT